MVYFLRQRIRRCIFDLWLEELHSPETGESKCEFVGTKPVRGKNSTSPGGGTCRQNLRKKQIIRESITFSWTGGITERDGGDGKT